MSVGHYLKTIFGEFILREAKRRYCYWNGSCVSNVIWLVFQVQEQVPSSSVNTAYYYMAGSPQVNPSVLIGSFLVGILPYGPFMQIVFRSVYFVVFESVAKVTYNKVLPNLACSSQAEGTLARGSRCARSVLPRPYANIPITWPSRSVS